MMLYKKDCLNCGNIFDIEADSLTAYEDLFCSINCQEAYYKNKVLKKVEKLDLNFSIKKKRTGLDIHE